MWQVRPEQVAASTALPHADRRQEQTLNSQRQKLLVFESIPTGKPTYLSKYGGFLRWGYLQIIQFNGIFPYKPSIFGYPHLWKPPYIKITHWIGINQLYIIVPFFHSFAAISGGYQLEYCKIWGIVSRNGERFHQQKKDSLWHWMARINVPKSCHP